MVALVVAHSRNGCIGRDGDLPWRLPTDLKRFKEITAGGTVVMGRRTWESLPPAFRPLPGRRNVVLTRDAGFAAHGAEVAASLEEALAGDVFVIGGGEVYAQALDRADRVYATLVDADVEGDTFFPSLGSGWRLADESAPIAENGHAFTFRVYERDRLYHLEAARSAPQLERMQRLERERICTFCDDQHGQEVAHVGEHWYVVPNLYPYPGTREHWLIVPHAHVRAFDELPDAAGAELWAIKRLLKDRAGAAATATVERSGDMRLNGGSIAHLHVHFVVPDLEPERTVKFRVSRRGHDESAR